MSVNKEEYGRILEYIYRYSDNLEMYSDSEEIREIGRDIKKICKGEKQVLLLTQEEKETLFKAFKEVKRFFSHVDRVHFDSNLRWLWCDSNNKPVDFESHDIRISLLEDASNIVTPKTSYFFRGSDSIHVHPNNIEDVDD